MREKTIEKYLRDEVRRIGGRAYKFISPGNNGVPDRVICLPAGVVAFVELKAPGKEPKPHQKLQLGFLMELSQNVFVIDSKELVDAFMRWAAVQIEKAGDAR